MKILKFYADWCNPCKQQTKILDEMSLEVTSINIEDGDSGELVEKYNIMSVPVIVFLDDEGEEIKRFVGLTTRNALESFIKENG